MARKPGRALTEKWAEFSSKNGGFNQRKWWFYGGFMGFMVVEPKSNSSKSN